MLYKIQDASIISPDLGYEPSPYLYFIFVNFFGTSSIFSPIAFYLLTASLTIRIIFQILQYYSIYFFLKKIIFIMPRVKISQQLHQDMIASSNSKNQVNYIEKIKVLIQKLESEKSRYQLKKTLPPEFSLYSILKTRLSIMPPETQIMNENAYRYLIAVQSYKTATQQLGQFNHQTEYLIILKILMQHDQSIQAYENLQFIRYLLDRMIKYYWRSTETIYLQIINLYLIKASMSVVTYILGFLIKSLKKIRMNLKSMNIMQNQIFMANIMFLLQSCTLQHGLKFDQKIMNQLRDAVDLFLPVIVEQNADEILIGRSIVLYLIIGLTEKLQDPNPLQLLINYCRKIGIGNLNMRNLMDIVEILIKKQYSSDQMSKKQQKNCQTLIRICCYYFQGYEPNVPDYDRKSDNALIKNVKTPFSNKQAKHHFSQILKMMKTVNPDSFWIICSYKKFNLEHAKLIQAMINSWVSPLGQIRKILKIIGPKNFEEIEQN